jgi:hypothetical protein
MSTELLRNLLARRVRDVLERTDPIHGVVARIAINAIPAFVYVAAGGITGRSTVTVTCECPLQEIVY